MIRNGLVRSLGDVVLVVQPVFAIPVYFSVLAGTPPLWLSLVVALLPVGVRFWITRRLFSRTAFDVPIVVFIIGMLVGLLVSSDRAVAVGGIASSLASILIYYGIASNSDRGNRYWPYVGAIICALAFMLSIWFFSQGTARIEPFNAWFFKLFDAIPKSPGPVLQFNSLGAILAVLIPVLFGLAVFTTHRGLRWGAFSLGLAFLALLAFTASGGGWIATFCGLAVIFFVWKKWTAFVAVPSAGFSAAAASIVYRHTVWLQQTFSTGSLLTRFTLWKNTIHLFSGRSIVAGLGFGGWAAAYNGHFGETQTHVHNSYLQLYADTGIVGIAALALAAAIFVRLSMTILSSSRRQPWFGFAAGLIAAIVAGAAMAMYDVTTTVTVMETSGYLYMSVPLLWVWAALLVVAQKKLASEE